MLSITALVGEKSDPCSVDADSRIHTHTNGHTRNIRKHFSDIRRERSKRIHLRSKV